MNDQGITLGEMGYGDPEGETLRGEPMPFLLRDVLAKASNIDQVKSILSTLSSKKLAWAAAEAIIVSIRISKIRVVIQRFVK